MRLKKLNVGGSINLIEKDVFKTFKFLKSFNFWLEKTREFFHRNGIDWINSLNENVNVDLNDAKATKSYFDRVNFDKISCEIRMRWALDFVFDTFESRYPDTDFCLYALFPFNKLIYILDSIYTNLSKKNATPTCTYLFLAQYFPIFDLYSQIPFINSGLNLDLFNKLVDQCDFQKRLDICNRYTVKLL